MRLDRYLNDHAISRSDFAKRIRVNPSTITRLIDGTRLPSGALLAAIQRETDGLVTFSDFDWPEPIDNDASTPAAVEG